MKVSYDFLLDLWVQNLEIEGTSETDCLNKLKLMTLGELLSEGYVKDREILDLEQEILEEDFTIEVSNIVWEREAPKDLPTSGVVKVSCSREGLGSDGALEDAIWKQIGGKEWYPDIFDYKIID